MQSRKRMKIQDYALGDAVSDEGYYAGAVEAVMADPDEPSVAYMLVVTDGGHYTTYRGSTTVRCGLSLARRVPRRVAQAFAKVVLGGEPPAELPRKRTKKIPVTQASPPPEAEPVLGGTKAVSAAPYFDFV